MSRILIVGASGLVGGLVAKLLDQHDLIALGRRSVDGLANQRIAPVADWPAQIADIKPDIVISTLGTTIRAAGSKEAFAAIDHDAVLSVATAAKAAGARQFLMVSSVGAGGSGFYLQTKGRTEADVRALGFDRLDIFRPGLLIGDRGGPARPFEAFMISISPLTNALTPRAFDHYCAIAASDVAAAIVKAVDAAPPGTFIHHNREMLSL